MRKKQSELIQAQKKSWSRIPQTTPLRIRPLKKWIEMKGKKKN